jgi:hypothetical protein
MSPSGGIPDNGTQRDPEYFIPYRIKNCVDVTLMSLWRHQSHIHGFGSCSGLQWRSDISDEAGTRPVWVMRAARLI